MCLVCPRVENRSFLSTAVLHAAFELEQGGVQGAVQERHPLLRHKGTAGRLSDALDGVPYHVHLCDLLLCVQERVRFTLFSLWLGSDELACALCGNILCCITYDLVRRIRNSDQRSLEQYWGHRPTPVSSASNRRAVTSAAYAPATPTLTSTLYLGV